MKYQLAPTFRVKFSPNLVIEYRALTVQIALLARPMNRLAGPKLQRGYYTSYSKLNERNLSPNFIDVLLATDCSQNITFRVKKEMKN